jgi:Ca2+-binding RTX toxin-like protein
MATIRGTNLRNILNGTAVADTILGLGGNDDLKGLAGNDTLDGGTGADKMWGGKGNDTYLVDKVGDRAIELAGQGTDIVKSKVTFTLGANVENLTLTGTANVNGTGNTLANKLTGNAGRNTLNGNRGNDNINGGAGDDTLDGGLGNDTLNGSTGVHDRVLYTTAASVPPQLIDGIFFVTGVAVNLTTGGARELAAGSIDTLIGIEDVTGSAHGDLLIGNADANTLIGGAGVDGIDGRAGNDTIIGGTDLDYLRGGLGADTMTGGVGQDLFFWGTAADSGVGAGNRDVITDFVAGVDKIDLSEIDALTYLGTDNDGFRFIGAAAFTTGGLGSIPNLSEVRASFDAASNQTIVQINVQTSAPGVISASWLNSDLVVDLEIALAGNVTLAASDFVL